MRTRNGDHQVFEALRAVWKPCKLGRGGRQLPFVGRWGRGRLPFVGGSATTLKGYPAPGGGWELARRPGPPTGGRRVAVGHPAPNLLRPMASEISIRRWRRQGGQVLWKAERGHSQRSAARTRGIETRVKARKRLALRKETEASCWVVKPPSCGVQVVPSFYSTVEE